MTSEFLRKTAVFFVYVAIIGTPLFYFSQGVYPFVLSKSLFFQFAATGVIFFWLALMAVDGRYRPKRTPLSLALLLFFIVLTITAVFGNDTWRSFWSTQERAVGVSALWQLFGFFLAVVALRADLAKENLWYVSIAVASAVSFIAEIQLKVPDLLVSGNTAGRPGATLGNPAFLAGYLLPHIFIIGYFLLEKLRDLRRQRNNLLLIFLAGSLIVQLGALFHSESRGSLIALVAGILALLFMFAVEPPRGFGYLFSRRSFYVIVLVVILAGSFGFWFTRASPLWEGAFGIRRFQELSEDALAPRMAALAASWQGFKEKPILGWGWDNFNIVFNKYYDPNLLKVNYQETRFDKPHNFLAEYAIAGGIPLLAAAIYVFFIFSRQALTLKDPLFGKIAFAAMISYAVHNIFLFETIGALLVWYLVMAKVDGDCIAEEKRAVSRAAKNSKAKTRIYFSLAAGAVAIYFISFLPLVASYRQYQAIDNYLNGRTERAFENFKSAAAGWNPYGWMMKRDYAVAIATAYFKDPEKISDGEARLAVQAMEEVVHEHPYDAQSRAILVNVYNQVSDVDPQYLARAEREAQEALKLSPRRQEIYFYLAKTKTLQRENEEALEILRSAIDLAPEVSQGHFYYGLVAFAGNKPEQGFLEVEKAIALGLNVRDKDELMVAANYYVDNGYASRTVPLYKKMVEIDDSDIEAKLKLGVAYYLSGEFDGARRYILEAGREFDFKDSNLYLPLKPIFQDLGLNL